MTLPQVIRIFFAVELPDEIKERLGRFISELKKKSKSHAIRWTKAENLHITLQFLAEVKTEDLVPLINNVRKQIDGALKGGLLSFGTLHLFPTPYRPRVIVLEITQQESLALLAELIGEGIKQSNYPIETRPFRAHLTLGRIKRPGVNLQFLSSFAEPKVVEKIDMKEVVLFRSEPLPEGSQYTVLERFSLS